MAGDGKMTEGVTIVRLPFAVVGRVDAVHTLWHCVALRRR